MILLRLLPALLLLLGPTLAHAQRTPAFQSGSDLVPGDVLKHLAPGLHGKGSGRLGDVNGRGVNPFLVEDELGVGPCSTSARVGQPRNVLCLGHDATGAAVVSVDSYDGLAGKSLKFVIDGTENVIPGSITGAPVIATNAALNATSTGTYSTIIRVGHTVRGDTGSPLVMNASGSACSLGAGAGDGGTQVASSDGGCWLADTRGTIDIRQFGAKCDGTTDDAAAINAALASAATVIVGPNAACRSSATINITGGKTLTGENAANTFSAAGSPVGFRIVCDLAVTPCIKGLAANDSVSLRNVSATRAAGTIPAASVGILIEGAAYPLLDNVGSYRADDAIYIKSTGVAGVSGTLTKVQTCAVTGSHLVIDGWPHIRVSDSTFGCAGAFDQASDNFILITDSASATGNGPNTVYVSNSHFNQGSGQLAHCWLNFFNLGPEQGTLAAIFNFDHIYVETTERAVCSNAGATNITNLNISDSMIVGGFVAPSPFFEMNAASVPNFWHWSNNMISGWDSFVIAPSSAFSWLHFTGNSFNTTTATNVSITGVGASTVTLTDNMYVGLTLAGNFSSALVSGNSASQVVNTATGAVSINTPGYSTITATCALRFGGASTGITYASTPACRWQRIGNVVTFGFFIQLTSKGSATGAGSVSGLPYNGSGSLGNGSATLYAPTAGYSALAGPVIGSTAAASPTINLFQFSATGLVVVTDTNFTNTSVLQGLITYMVDPGN